MPSVRGLLFVFTLLFALSSVKAADKPQNETTVVVSPNATVPSNSSTVVTPVSNTTVIPVTGSTEKEDEKPITEKIRTIIEDSVKSVKHAISKIGKFVGEFFEDTPTNSTVPVNVSISTPSASGTTTVSLVSNTTSLPTDAPK